MYEGHKIAGFLPSNKKNALLAKRIITPHAHARAWGYVIGASAHSYVCIYVCIYVCDPQKSLSGTLVIDFQTLAVDFSSN